MIAIETPIYFPTNVELNAYHKNTAEGNWDNIFSLRTDDLRYEIIDEIPIPNNISLYIYTSPFQHNLSITKINPKTFDIAFYMDESQCNFSINSRFSDTIGIFSFSKSRFAISITFDFEELNNPKSLFKSANCIL